MSATTPRKQPPAVKIGAVTPAERGAINILTPDERRAALLAAARRKAALLIGQLEA